MSARVGESRAVGVGAPAAHRSDKQVLDELVEIAEQIIARPYIAMRFRERIAAVRDEVAAALYRPATARIIQPEDAMLVHCLAGVLDCSGGRITRFVAIASAILPHTHDNLRVAIEIELAGMLEREAVR